MVGLVWDWGGIRVGLWQGGGGIGVGLGWDYGRVGDRIRIAIGMD